MRNIRPASLSDVEAMLKIYDPYVLNTPITFEIQSPTILEFQKRLTDTQEKLPWIVCEEDAQVLGYAYANPFKTRRAFDWTVESTVYVHQDFHGKGIGKDLYRRLIELLNYQGVVNVVGGIALPNQASVGLHESLGFQKVADFKDAGFKLGKWWNVGYWQLQIQKPSTPEALRPLPADYLI